jgi:hypothetical protein
MMVIATPNTHQPWRVGVIFSQSGVMAVIEEQRSGRRCSPSTKSLRPAA